MYICETVMLDKYFCSFLVTQGLKNFLSFQKQWSKVYKDFTTDVSRTVSNMMEVMHILNKALLKRGEFKHCVRSC